MEIEQMLDLLSRLPPESAIYRETARVLDSNLEVVEPPPLPDLTPRPKSAKRLTIGMATYDDFDGVYFSVQAIRLYHPEVTAATEILVVDNHPEGRHAAALKQLEKQVPGYRYVPFNAYRGTWVREVVFREARTDFVLCVDSHVLFVPGALKRLLAYLESHPDTSDLLQGPVIYDDLESAACRFDPEWSGGMWGRWGGRTDDLAGREEPFEIPMQGLGMFACRREAWPGTNPHCRGFGGEEGFVHEKFRRQGGRVLCLPWLKWLHRFSRPLGTRYENTWMDRIRNYCLCFAELGWELAPVEKHYSELLGQAAAAPMIASARREIESPFAFFDGIYCIHLPSQTGRWDALNAQLSKLGIERRVTPFAAAETPYSSHVGCALSHRRVVALAKYLGLRHVLVLEDDVVFAGQTEAVLQQSLKQLETLPEWQTLYLGGARWRRPLDPVPGCSHLGVPHGMTCTHAIAYHHTFYDRILAGIPETASGVALWLRQHRAIDQWLACEFDGMHLATQPLIASQWNLLPYEPEGFEDHLGQ